MLINVVPPGVGVSFALARVLAAVRYLVVSRCILWR